MSLINSSLEFKTVASDRLFYDHWQYCIKFHLDEVNCLRYGLDNEEIDDVLARRILWRDRVRKRWPHNNFVRPHAEITDLTRENLYAFADFLQKTTDPYKIVISMNQCWIYTNNVLLLERIDRLPFVNNAKCSRSVIVRARDTVSLKNPQHRYRSYFRSVKLSQQERTQLSDFLTQQQVRISPALAQWIATPFNRTQNYFFVDYDCETWLTLLALVRPGLIRRTVTIVAK